MEIFFLHYFRDAIYAFLSFNCLLSQLYFFLLIFKHQLQRKVLGKMRLLC